MIDHDPAEEDVIHSSSDVVPAGALDGAPPPDAAGRYRVETELRRLRAELERQQQAMQVLTGRLRDAEREAAEASGAVVDAMTAQLAVWQDRAEAAEAELVAVRATKIYRAASPFMALYRVRRRIPELSRKVVNRLS